MAIVTTDNQHYTDIAAAIRSKNGTETLYKPSEMAAAIQAISGGGGEPEPPDDGKTRLYITVPANAMPDRPPPRNQVPLYIQQTVANGVTIDWGDGTAPETLPGTGAVNTKHTYEQAGDYVISLEPADGCELRFGWNVDGEVNVSIMGNIAYDYEYQSFYTSMLKKVYIGKNVYDISLSLAFYRNLMYVKTPNNMTNIGEGAFGFTFLTSTIVSSEVTNIESAVFYNCIGLKDVYLYPISPPTIQTDTFYGVPSDCTYHVRPESLEEYKAATNWTTIADQIVGDLEA